jgi:hypothetical protein
MRKIAVAFLIASCLAPVVATADHPLGNIPWPNLLPPMPGVAAPAHPAEPCHPAKPRCVDGVIDDMVRAWEPQDASCDHRAVFALTYLITTQGFRGYLSDVRGSAFFEDEPGIIQLDRTFANLYFAAVEQYIDGQAPPAWRIAFQAADSGRSNAIQDLFLGMNAHIQRDLPVALAAVGLVDETGASRRADHNRVNEILSAVLDDIEDEVAARYDSMISLFDASPSPVDEEGALEVLKSWREGAWRNAERLTLAKSDAERAVVMQQIEAYAETWARIISAADFSFDSARRDAYCGQRNASRPPGGTKNANSA